MDQDESWRGGRPRTRPRCVRWGPSPSPKGTQPPILAHICCGPTAGWIKMPLGMEVGLGPGDIVLDGDPAAPPPQRGGTAAPNFRPMYCGQTAGRIKMPLGTEVDLGPDHTVLSDDQPPAPKGSKVPSPLLLHPLPRVCCNQTAGWIKMRLSTEVGVGPGDIVLDGDPASLPLKAAQPPICGPCLLWPNGWMDQDGTWYGGIPRPMGHIVFMGTQLSRNGHSSPPPFRPTSIVAERSPISAAAELFL